MALVKNNAAILVNDNNTDDVLKEAIKLLDDAKLCNSIAVNAKQLGKPNATQDIVNEVFKLTN